MKRNVTPLLNALLAFAVIAPYPAFATIPLPKTESPYAEGVPVGGAVSIRTPLVATATKPPSLAGSVISTRVKTVRVRKDTVLRMRLLQDLNTANVREGEGFTASLDEALFASEGRIILPKGSVFRGRVVQVVPSQFFGKGASLRLDFDHVTLPNGEAQPIALQVFTVNQRVEVVKSGGIIYQDPGYAQKWVQTLDKSGTLISDITRKGYEAGVQSGGKGLGIVTGPFSAIGGSLAGAGYLVGKSVYYAVAKGDGVLLTANDALYVQLLADTDIALN
jgi:hypothetical protein